MLTKTLILPTDDAAKAKSMLRQAIYEEPYVLFVVFGTEKESERLVRMADRAAGRPDEWRWVVWARRPHDVADVITGLPDWAGDLGGTRAVCLGLSDHVADRIAIDDTVDILRVVEAYLSAEAA